jgi:hypothetical protein
MITDNRKSNVAHHYYIYNASKETAYKFFTIDDVIEVLQIKRFPEDMFIVVGKGGLLYVGGRIPIQKFKDDYIYKLRMNEKFENYKYVFYINLMKENDWYHPVWKKEEEKDED